MQWWAWTGFSLLSAVLVLPNETLLVTVLFISGIGSGPASPRAVFLPLEQDSSLKRELGRCAESPAFTLGQCGRGHSAELTCGTLEELGVCSLHMLEVNKSCYTAKF